MRIAPRSLALLLPLAAAACLGDSTVRAGTPINCATLATSYTTATDLTTTPSGLKYRDTAVGTGFAVDSGTFVAVHYAGCLTSGKTFDENLDNQSPAIFQVGVGSLIKGFDEGLRGMKVGGTRQLVIPPTLGYGSSDVKASDGSVVIPGNSTLIFTVQLWGAQ